MQKIQSIFYDFFLCFVPYPLSLDSNGPKKEHMGKMKTGLSNQIFFFLSNQWERGELMKNLLV